MHTVSKDQILRRLPIGTEILDEGKIHFRVWASKARRVHVVLYSDSASSAADAASSITQPAELDNFRLQDEGNGYFSLLTDRATVGMRYGFRLDHGQRLLPDPASRFQPEGPSGLSQIVDPHLFPWTDTDWKGIGPLGQVIYELHFGTFTSAGTFAAAAAELPELARIGITVIELMPVTDFPGKFGWGYDGVNMFAPTRLYGMPDDFRRFVDLAHALHLGVILDVVYNHFGNVDNYLGEFSGNFKSSRHKNEWADAINFDGPDAQPVRDFFEANARYWIEEFHVDGYRYDATHAIHDDSAQHILAIVNRAARQAAAPRQVLLVAENEVEDIRMVRPMEQGGCGMDAAWNDDFHHSARVRLTGANPAYYSDFLGTMEELAAAIKHGFIYQGQRSQWQHKLRGTPTMGLPATAFVCYLQNHDQISNSATGERIHQLTSPGRYRAMTALWLLAPQTPLFFQGQEFAASSPFLFFADFQGDMAEAVRRGRGEFLSQFPTLATPQMRRHLADPCNPATLQRCKLDFAQRESHRQIYDLHIDLLKLRREDPVFRSQRADRLDTATLSTDCLAVRYAGDSWNDRLVLTNFGSDLHLIVLSQPLLAPPPESRWQALWSSNSDRYGGPGIAPFETDQGWFIAGESTIVLEAVPTGK